MRATVITGAESVYFNYDAQTHTDVLSHYKRQRVNGLWNNAQTEMQRSIMAHIQVR
jgi:hypothetical protein